MENIYNERLLRFAKHLETITEYPEGLFENVTIVVLEKGNVIRYEAKYHYWIFEELPVCFSDWEFDERFGNPVWVECNPEDGPAASVIDFFSLTLPQFSHLFDIESVQDVKRFGGKPLIESSTSLDIAFNIRELVKRRK